MSASAYIFIDTNLKGFLNNEGLEEIFDQLGLGDLKQFLSADNVRVESLRTVVYSFNSWDDIEYVNNEIIDEYEVGSDVHITRNELVELRNYFSMFEDADEDVKQINLALQWLDNSTTVSTVVYSR